MRTYIAAALVFCATGVCAASDDYSVLDQRAQQLDNWQARVDANYAPAAVVSREAKVPVATVEEQRTRTHLGYGGLLIANSLAAETGRSFDEIVAQKSDGHGWGAIAQENHVQVGNIVSRIDRADADFNAAKSKHKHHGKHHRHGKGKGHHKHK